ncbi:hypothetical protein PR048_023806 [Dryococelus australis]|uniref:Uncharacterized protein n=1 Tax=Dryococelus australis TaxID=614101 RepID=A0ABQ9GV30_9NEOP|nr:hypothetical protein PR048_023806 [Dryococelus australis]
MELEVATGTLQQRAAQVVSSLFYRIELNRLHTGVGLSQGAQSQTRGVRGRVVVGLIAFHLGQPGSIPGWVAPGYSHVGNRAGRCRWSTGFLRISRFPRPSVPALLHTHFTLPSSVIKKFFCIFELVVFVSWLVKVRTNEGLWTSRTARGTLPPRNLLQPYGRFRIVGLTCNITIKLGKTPISTKDSYSEYDIKLPRSFFDEFIYEKLGNQEIFGSLSRVSTTIRGKFWHVAFSCQMIPSAPEKTVNVSALHHISAAVFHGTSFCDPLDPAAADWRQASFHVTAALNTRRGTLASHQGEPGSIPGRVTGFSQVGIVSDDAVGRRVLSRISRFPPTPPPPSFRCRSIVSSITLVGFQELTVKSRPILLTQLLFPKRQAPIVCGLALIAAVLMPSPMIRNRISGRLRRTGRSGRRGGKLPCSGGVKGELAVTCNIVQHTTNMFLPPAAINCCLPFRPWPGYSHILRSRYNRKRKFWAMAYDPISIADLESLCGSQLAECGNQATSGAAMNIGDGDGRLREIARRRRTRWALLKKMSRSHVDSDGIRSGTSCSGKKTRKESVACQQLADESWLTYGRPEAVSQWTTAAIHGPQILLPGSGLCLDIPTAHSSQEASCKPSTSDGALLRLTDYGTVCGLFVHKQIRTTGVLRPIDARLLLNTTLRCTGFKISFFFEIVATLLCDNRYILLQCKTLRYRTLFNVNLTVGSILKTCDTREKYKHTNEQLRGAMQPIPSAVPQELVEADIFAPLPQSRAGITPSVSFGSGKLSIPLAPLLEIGSPFCEYNVRGVNARVASYIMSAALENGSSRGAHILLLQWHVYHFSSVGRCGIWRLAVRKKSSVQSGEACDTPLCLAVFAGSSRAALCAGRCLVSLPGDVTVPARLGGIQHALVITNSVSDKSGYVFSISDLYCPEFSSLSKTYFQEVSTGNCALLSPTYSQQQRPNAAEISWTERSDHSVIYINATLRGAAVVNNEANEIAKILSSYYLVSDLVRDEKLLERQRNECKGGSVLIEEEEEEDLSPQWYPPFSPQENPCRKKSHLLASCIEPRTLVV